MLDPVARLLARFLQYVPLRLLTTAHPSRAAHASALRPLQADIMYTTEISCLRYCIDTHYVATVHHPYLLLDAHSVKEAVVKVQQKRAHKSHQNLPPRRGLRRHPGGNAVHRSNQEEDEGDHREVVEVHTVVATKRAEQIMRQRAHYRYRRKILRPTHPTPTHLFIST